MFQSIKVYRKQEIDLEEFLSKLSEFGYTRQQQVLEEGDFSRRGEVIDIFPCGFEFPVRIELENTTINSIKSFSITNGNSLWHHDMLIILPKKTSVRFRIHKFSEDIPLEGILDLKKGDFVVHVQYGIGKYLGIEKIKVSNRLVDHIVIEYLGHEKLFVPMHNMSLIQKYISFSCKPPKLNKLGTKNWLHTKENAKKGIRKMALGLLELQARRQIAHGFKFSPDGDWQIEFEHSFPFKETPDQAQASYQVKKDMESAFPMDRLICGDVGYGKTEVAMRAAFKAVMNNKQVAILVPTTILAEQHYHNFAKRISDFPVRVEMLSRFKTGKQQKQIIADLSKGKVDIIIGTHRLLSNDIKFTNLGLLVIDEEQRFGVRAKEKLKRIRLNVDVLTLTATPIPRTLYMSLMGVKNISVINTPPEDRLAIKTYVTSFDEDLVREAIIREVKRCGQVYFVHNRIKDIEKIKKRLQQLQLREVKFGLAHGKMPVKILEKVMLDFLNNKIQVLVSTNIIESGIDIPNANTLIVNNADCFGLADLHQLRGRVGRFKKQAFAYFLVPRRAFISPDAKKRLQALQEYAELGSGFKIAMKDLEIRGAGNLLGVQQHGFITAIGFDLYCRLLKETINVFTKHYKKIDQNLSLSLN